eukprot:EC794319.1.p3 GENE.EC794319.1~~EC794319.1.p3  ORF type:complete len:88 (-),score=15.60 EC794319.1:359-622(-)
MHTPKTMSTRAHDVVDGGRVTGCGSENATPPSAGAGASPTGRTTRNADDMSGCAAGGGGGGGGGSGGGGDSEARSSGDSTGGCGGEA